MSTTPTMTESELNIQVQTLATKVVNYTEPYPSASLIGNPYRIFQAKNQLHTVMDTFNQISDAILCGQLNADKAGHLLKNLRRLLMKFPHLPPTDRALAHEIKKGLQKIVGNTYQSTPHQP